MEFTSEQAEKIYNRETPFRGTSGASGFDLRYCGNSPVSLSHLIPQRLSSGIRMSIPTGYEAQIRSRSGYAAQGLVITNAPGTVDSDYRGEIQLLCHTLVRSTIIRPGDRIAQLVIAPVASLDIVLGDVDMDTERGEDGFGSTGTS